MHDLGRQLKRMRDAREMTQREVAQAAGIQPSHLSRIESGKQNCQLSTVEAVLEALGAGVAVTDNEERKGTAEVG